MGNSNANGKTTLRHLSGNSWGFYYPLAWGDITEETYHALELMESETSRDRKTGINLLKDITNVIENHPLALSEYGFFLMDNGKKDEGLKLIQKVVENGKALFAENFSPGKDRLEWAWLENRPFLRCMHWLAINNIDSNNHTQAIVIIKEMLALNPNDNQGVRELAAKYLFVFKKPEEILELCDKYKNDAMPGILYSRPLALFQLGRKEEADQALGKAIKSLPLVAKELVNPSKTKPRSPMPGYITFGGRDQAWEYCADYRIFWEQTEGAVWWVKKTMEGKC